MKKYELTLTKAVRVNGKRHELGSVVEVDKRTFAELKYHQAFEKHVEVIVDTIDHNKQNSDAQIPQTPAATLIKTLPDYKNIKADEIKDQLLLREIPFDTNDKSELYELLKTAMENEPESGE